MSVILSNIEVEYVHQLLCDRRYHFVYQPINNIQTGETVAHEALVRFDFNHTQFDNIQDFINVGEVLCSTEFNSGLYNTLLKSVAYFNRPIHFNMSLYNPEFLEDLTPHPNIKLEITEDYCNNDRLISLIRKKIKEGFEIGIDDFGKGYNSLNYFFDEPLGLKFVKFDKSLIKKLNLPSIRKGLNRLRLLFEEDLGVDVIVEGIETQEVLVQLKEDGYKYGQGFYINSPLMEPLQ